MPSFKKLLSAAVGLSLLTLAAVPGSSQAAEAPLVVSGYSTSRVDSNWGLFSSCGADLRDMLTDPANFGPGGIVDRPISLSDPGVDTVTPGSLDGVDVFFTGWVLTSTYTDDERTALRDFVLAGGAVIATTDDLTHNIADLFGVTLENGSYSTGTPTAPASPLITGPFGTVTSLVFSGQQGIYSGLGSATEIVEADPDLGPAVALLPPGALAPGSGPVVLVADVDVFTTEGCASGPGSGANANRAFVLNVFAYLAGLQQAPVETTTTTAASSSTTSTTGPGRAMVTAPRFTG